MKMRKIYVPLPLALVFLLFPQVVHAGCSGGCGSGCGAGCGCRGGCRDSCGEAAAQAVQQADFVRKNQTVADAQKIGNTICPVQGEPIDPETRFEAYYDGKLINLCCEGCLSL